ncbi:MAG: hypothetical protein Q9159_000032 [Coniocarpon cinnabarinum]
MFKKPKRVPRKVGRDEDEDASTNHPSTSQDEFPVVVKRASKPKTSKAARAAVARTVVTTDDDAVAQPSRRSEDDDPFAAVERRRAVNAAQKSRLSSDNLPYRSGSQQESDHDAPRYTSDYLAELKAEQLTAPPVSAQLVPEDELPPSPPPPTDSTDLEGLGVTDINPSYAHASILPTSTSLITPSSQTQTAAIPSAIEIAEKKARRARLAAEEKADEFIKLSDDDASSSSDDDNRNSSLILKAEERKHKDKYGRDESRIGQYALDDDNFAEGFDEFVEDPARIQTITGTESRRAARAQRRKDIARHIAADSDDNDDDLEEKSRMRAYDAAQLHNATYNQRNTVNHAEHEQKRKDREREAAWRRQCEKRYIVRPIPRMADVKRRLREKRETLQKEKEEVVRRIENIRRERQEIESEEGRIQVLLKEAGERLERVMKGESADGGAGGSAGGAGGEKGGVEDGLKDAEEGRAVRTENAETTAASESNAEDEPMETSDSEPAEEGGPSSERSSDDHRSNPPQQVEINPSSDSQDEDDDIENERPGLGTRRGLGA